MSDKAVAQKDDNAKPSWAGISCVDGITPVKIQFVNGAMKTDAITSISVVPMSISNNDGNGYPVVKGVSSGDSRVVLPWYVNPSTGAVLIES